MRNFLLLIFILFTNCGYGAEITPADSEHGSEEENSSVDEEDESPTTVDEVRARRDWRGASGLNLTTGWENCRLGHCVGKRSRLLWWYVWFEKDVQPDEAIYVINEKTCKVVQEKTAKSLLLKTEDRLRCEITKEFPHITLTFGGRSSIIVSQRLEECEEEWSTIGALQAIRLGTQPLPEEEQVQRLELHQTWLRKFQSSAPVLENSWNEQTCASPELFKGIYESRLPPGIGFEFEFSTASFEPCTWNYGKVLGKTTHVESGKLLLTWTAEASCGLELRTHARPLSKPDEKSLILASILSAYLVWANMIGQDIQFADVMNSISGSLDRSNILPPEISPLIRKRLNADVFTLKTEQDPNLVNANSMLRQKGGAPTGMNAQMNAAMPFLIYDPVCLEIWQKEKILIQNDNPLRRLMTHPDLLSRIKRYGEPYIRAMLGYLMEIFLSLKNEALSTNENSARPDFRNYYNLLPKINWQERSDVDPIRFKTEPDKLDFKLYREGLKIFKREFAAEIVGNGIEFGSNAWRDLTSYFRSPRYTDFYHRRQTFVKRHTFPPFLINGHVFIVCEFRGPGLRGAMSGRLNVMMMRGLSDALGFRSGDTFLYPDLVKLDRIFKNVENLQSQKFDENCMPVLHPEDAVVEQQDIPDAPRIPLEIQSEDRVQKSIPNSVMNIGLYFVVFGAIVLLLNFNFRETSTSGYFLIEEEL